MRIGIVGAGAMGAMHADAYGRIPGADVVAVYSRTKERATATADQVGASASADFDALLADDAIEALDICLPSAVHREFVVPALEAGKHVFCEAPLALTLEDATAMSEAARANERLLLVALLMRSVPEYAH